MIDKTDDHLPTSGEEIFKNIADYTYDWESWFSPEGKLLWVNRAVERLTGYTTEECLNMSNYPFPFVLEEDKGIVKGIWQKGENQESGNNVSFRIIHKNGNVVWVAFSWNPMYNSENELLGVRTSARDFTERKIAEDTYRENEAQFSSIVQNVPGTIYRYTSLEKCEILFISNQFESLTGYKTNDFIGKCQKQFIKLIHPDDLDESQRLRDNALKNKVPFDIEYRISTKENTIKWVQERGCGIYNDAGELEFQDGTFFDITAIKDSQLNLEERTTELQESQSQFTSMVSNVPGVIFRCLLDEAWTMMFISDEIQNLSGYPAKDFLNNSKRTFADIMHKDDTKQTSEYINETLKKGEVFHVDYRILTSNGEVKWVRGQGQAVTAKRSEIEYIDGVIFDITEQKIAEIEIANANEKVRLILESAGEGILGVDRQGITTFVNSAALRMLGYTQEEVIGECIHELAHSKLLDGSFYPVEECPMHKTYTHGSTNHVDTEVLWRKDGSSFPVDYISKPIIKNGKSLGAVITFSDITKRIDTEKKILSAKETSDLIIEQSPIPMVITSAEGKILKANKEALKFMEIPTFEELQEFNIVEAYNQPEQRKELFKRVNHSSVKNFETEIIQLGSGNVRQVLLSSSEINYQNTPCLLSSMMDVTDIRQYEEKLSKAKDQAEAANRAKSTFLANMSHELRTPMNAIIGYSEMLIEDAEDMNEPVFVSDLQRIRKSGKHLLSLINDVLDLSKVEAGKMQVSVESFNLVDLVHDIKETITGLVEKNNNAFVVDIINKQVVLSSDYMKLKQSLLNLLSNAAKFTEKGTVTLKTFPQGDNIYFQVSDTGIGIPEESIKTLFDEFTQADDTTTREYEGTGLGLAITKRFCKMLNGSVSVESQKGKGSVFTIEVPISYKVPVKKSNAEDETSTKEKLNHRPVLIIEDDDNSADLIAKSLTKEGFEIIRAKDGTQGIELARKYNPFAITLDVMMPGKDGWAILIELKNDDTLKGIPVIMVSVLDNLELGYALGAKDYLVKPVNKEALLSTIEECIPQTNKNTGPVLIVDDEADARDLLEKILTKQGWHSQTAFNGKDALDKIAIQKPSLILLDIMMPVMDGFAFIKELKKIDNAKHIPVIIVTARDLSPNEFASLNTDTDGIVHKSAYKKDDLMEQIKELVINIKRDI